MSNAKTQIPNEAGSANDRSSSHGTQAYGFELAFGFWHLGLLAVFCLAFGFLTSAV
jgi:hypothetical protein